MGQQFNDTPEWVEEFNSLNPKDWNIGTNISGGKCLSTFDGRYIFVKDGKLILISDIAKADNGDKYYRQAYVNTYLKHSFKYGKLEIRAKSPTGRGVWPAIWLVSENRNHYPTGEIDIFEYVDIWNGREFQGNIHCYTSPENRRSFAAHAFCDITDFHTYTLEWTRDSLQLKMDNSAPYLIYQRSNSNGWFFDENYYLIINVEFGRGWGGSWGVDENALPCQMEVDWIKYYKLQD